MMNLLQACREKSRFELHAFVIMPDHMHLLITPSPDVSLEKTVQFIKGGFSFQLKSKLDIWQRGYNETRIKSGGNFEACKAYIELNPVRARLVERAEMFPFSSMSRPEFIDERPPWFETKARAKAPFPCSDSAA